MNDQMRPRSYGDYLHALAVRTLLEESVLQPRKAALFETEFAGLDVIEAPLEAVAGLEPRPETKLAAAPVPPDALPGTRPSASMQPPAVPLTAPGGMPFQPRQPRPGILEATSSIGDGGPRAGSAQSSIAAAVLQHQVPVSSLPGAKAGAPLPVPPAPGPGTRRPAVTRTLDSPLDANMSPGSEPRPRGALFTAPTPPVAAAPFTPPRATEPDSSPRPGPIPARSILRPAAVSPAAPHMRTPRTSRERDAGVLVAHAVPEMRSMAPLFPAAHRPVKEPPPVEITIGRLEIRAGSPRPVVAPPRAAPQPRSTLKEYLNRGAGGRS